MTEEFKKGTRCAVCTFCGRCFEEEATTASADGWSGERCAVCVGCGKCMREWGLVGSGEADAESGPTNWADAFKVMDTGSAGAPPPVLGAPGAAPDGVDAVTGATPGVASACKDLGLDDMGSVAERLGIKPPGEA